MFESNNHINMPRNKWGLHEFLFSDVDVMRLAAHRGGGVSTAFMGSGASIGPAMVQTSPISAATQPAFAAAVPGAPSPIAPVPAPLPGAASPTTAQPGVQQFGGASSSSNSQAAAVNFPRAEDSPPPAPPKNKLLSYFPPPEAYSSQPAADFQIALAGREQLPPGDAVLVSVLLTVSVAMSAGMIAFGFRRQREKEQRELDKAAREAGESRGRPMLG
mmetsp:Transcript_708/g.1474  ORF Transcript_708/g.1474 Transcript_708/m.1474 type:complete len:217 (-) Transcript_708:17-667(-)